MRGFSNKFCTRCNSVEQHRFEVCTQCQQDNSRPFTSYKSAGAHWSGRSESLTRKTIARVAALSRRPK